MIGINPFGFSWELTPGETFQTPEAVLVYSSQGLNDMSQTFHRLYRRRLARGYWRDRERPILINNWEATYFNFTEEKLLQLASRAQKCGIELFVLDDGWFGARSSSKAGLGDWEANRDRLPNGLSGLAQKIEALGMKFGLWIEPEMVNADSDLFRTHPDWILQVPGRTPCHGRYQYVLDFSRQEILDYIYEKIVSILEGASISYIKWDMNRSLSDVWSRGVSARQQGEVFHRYILGVYQMYERLTTRFPDILFESCASGGARFDAGMLYYAPQGSVMIQMRLNACGFNTALPMVTRSARWDPMYLLLRTISFIVRHRFGHVPIPRSSERSAMNWIWHSSEKMSYLN